MNLKLISVSVENYLALKKLGSAGDSFNDVITEMLNNLKNQQPQKKELSE